MWNFLRGLLVTGALLASGASAGPEGPLILVDFPQSTEALLWFVVNDDVMGGRSEGGFHLEGDVLIFTGSTNTKGGGFSSIRSRSDSFDLSGYDGVRLRVRGDERTYTFRLTTWDTRDRQRRPAYWAEFETGDGTWMEIDVPFTRFRPRWRGATLPGPALEPAAIDSLGLMINDGQDGPFHLEVDWIAAYREVEPVGQVGDETESASMREQAVAASGEAGAAVVALGHQWSSLPGWYPQRRSPKLSGVTAQKWKPSRFQLARNGTNATWASTSRVKATRSRVLPAA